MDSTQHDQQFAAEPVAKIALELDQKAAFVEKVKADPRFQGLPLWLQDEFLTLVWELESRGQLPGDSESWMRVLRLKSAPRVSYRRKLLRQHGVIPKRKPPRYRLDPLTRRATFEAGSEPIDVLPTLGEHLGESLGESSEARTSANPQANAWANTEGESSTCLPASSSSSTREGSSLSTEPARRQAAPEWAWANREVNRLEQKTGHPITGHGRHVICVALLESRDGVYTCWLRAQEEAHTNPVGVLIRKVEDGKHLPPSPRCRVCGEQHSSVRDRVAELQPPAHLPGWESDVRLCDHCVEQLLERGGWTRIKTSPAPPAPINPASPGGRAATGGHHA